MDTTTKTVFESKAATIFVYPALKAVELRWQTYASGDEYRIVLSTGIEIVKEYNLNHWIGNLTNMEVITEADSAWTNEVFFPQLLSTTVKKLAIVVSTDIFNQLAVEEIMSQVAEGALSIQYFPSIEKALEWAAE